MILIGVAISLMTATLVIQSAGMAVLIVWGRAHFARNNLHKMDPFRGTLLMVRITTVMVCLHFVEICLWGGFYRWRCFSSWTSALYFSAANYSTVGCGDVLLPTSWRLLGPIESMAGVLMCGLSASFLFAVVTFLIKQEERYELKNSDRLSNSPRTRLASDD